MRRSASIFMGCVLSLAASPALAATSEMPPEDAVDLGKWLGRLGPGMLLVGLLVALLAFIMLRRTASRPQRVVIVALTLALGLPLVIGATLLAWNLGREAAVSGEVRAWNRLQQDVQITDGSGAVLEVPACGYASARLDTHRIEVAAGSRFLWTQGSGNGGPRYLIIDAASVTGNVRSPDTQPSQLPDCTPLPD